MPRQATLRTGTRLAECPLPCQIHMHHVPTAQRNVAHVLLVAAGVKPTMTRAVAGSHLQPPGIQRRRASLSGAKAGSSGTEGSLRDARPSAELPTRRLMGFLCSAQ